MKCMECGEEVKKVEAVGIDIGNFILKDQKANKARFSLSFGNKKIGNFEAKDGVLEEAYYCEKCKKAFVIYKL